MLFFPFSLVQEKHTPVASKIESLEQKQSNNFGSQTKVGLHAHAFKVPLTFPVPFVVLSAQEKHCPAELTKLSGSVQIQANSLTSKVNRAVLH
mgnify:CR=1 FL=1